MGDARIGAESGSRRRWVWIGAAVVVLALVASISARALTAGATERTPAPATVAADRGAVTAEVATIGTLQPVRTLSLSFAVAGTVEEIAVRPGTTVHPGQALARVDPTAAADAVDSARAALSDAEDALTRARSEAAASEQTPTCAADAPVAYPSKGPSPQRTTPAPTCSATTREQQRPGGGDAILSAEQRVNQATVTLAKAQDALDGATITAPITGKILSLSGTVGSQISAGSAFLTLADVRNMQISADFPEADADRLAIRQKAAVTLADRAGQSFAATVVQVDPVGTSDETMVRYGVLLSFDKAPGDLLVGQSADVRVTTGSADDVLRVPSTAVHDVTGDTGVVRRADGSTAKVGVGLRGDTYTEITAGLAATDEVVRSW
jgi:HlyD family secretion protein